jgi:hypothetical protein
MSDFGYANPNLPNVTNMQGALDYLVAVIYPNAKPAVATPADLPLVGNTLADYRVVNDDGDGRSAGYRWEQREGEAVPSWHKIYDVDWSTDSILSAWQNQTLAFYVQKIGHDDADPSGTPISGLYAGQTIYGGKSANTNLTLSANSGDGAGAQTGFVQVTDDFRPAIDSELELGTTSYRWLKLWSDAATIDTMTITSGSIVDTTGEIDFGSSDLVTGGDITSGTMTMGNGVITDTTGEVDFVDNDIRTTGDLYADQLFLTGGLTLPSGSQIADFTFTNGNIACATATVSLNALNLTTTGNATCSILNAGECQINLNSLTSVGTNKSLNLAATGTGTLVFQSEARTQYPVFITNSALTVSGTGSYITVDSLNLDGSTIACTSGDLNLSAAANSISIASSLKPSADNTKDLGDASLRFKSLYLGTNIQDGTSTFPIADLMKLKDANYRLADRSVGAQVGDALFWNGTQWLASAPDTEIAHGSLSGLTTGDAGHTQFALLAGRAGGQSLVGGTASGESLDLESTSNATKGSIQVKDNLRPFTDASYTTQWAGIDLGGSARRWKDVYTVGQFKGFRFENVDTLPSTSSSTPGKAYYLTTDQNLYIDTGLTVKQVGGSRVYYDTSWNGTDVTKDITVSGVDARFAQWQLKDNSNDFEIMYVSIKTTSATNVRITVGSPLPAGTYRLVGV